MLLVCSPAKRLLVKAYTTKVCKDCVYFKSDNSWFVKQSRIEYGYCTHPVSTTIDNVSGNLKYERAKYMREDKYSYKNYEYEPCSSKGVYFEEKRNKDTYDTNMILESLHFFMMSLFVSIILFMLIKKT